MLILAQHRHFELIPSPDIRIEQFKCLNCFLTIFKGFVSSEAEFVEVRFLVYVSCLSWPNIVLSSYFLSRTSKLSDSKAWHVFLPVCWPLSFEDDLTTKDIVLFYLCCCKVIHARAKRILDWRLKRRINQDRSKDVREMKNQAWDED